MAFVYYNQEIIRKEVQQTVRTGTCITPVKVAGIIFYARTMPQFANHLHIVCHALIESFRLIHFSFLLEFGHLFRQVVLNLMNSSQLALFGGHKKIGRINFVFIKSSQTDSRNRVDLFNGINFVVPKHNPEEIVAICQVNVYRVTFYAEIPAIQLYIVTHIQAVHQTA